MVKQHKRDRDVSFTNMEEEEVKRETLGSNPVNMPINGARDGSRGDEKSGMNCHNDAATLTLS